MNEIEKSLRVLCDIFKIFYLTELELSVYHKALAGYSEEVLKKTFDDAALLLDLPTASELRAICETHVTKQQVQTKKIDASSLLSATMSALWLHYRFGWSEADFEGSIFKQSFDKTFPGQQFSFNKLKQAFNRDEVLNWFTNWEKRHGLETV